jgi:tetratricopeptide (TPR) repeat protein
MSILDGAYKSKEEFLDGLTVASAIFGEFVKQNDLEDDEFLNLLQEGLSPSEIFDIPKRHLEALYSYAIQFMANGELQKARDLFTALCQWDYMDERYIYGLATTYQVAGEVKQAAQLYLQFLALDATNAEGYLRLGECLLMASELDEALSAFETAQGEAERGNGNQEAFDYAGRMIADVSARIAAQNDEKG